MLNTLRGAIVVTGALLVVDVMLTVVAVVSLLSDGPTPTGYGWVAAANHMAWGVGALVAVTAVLLAMNGRRRAAAWLVGATAAAVVGSSGLRIVGLALAQGTVAYSQQAESVDSLFLAMIGTGADLMLLPVAFTVAGFITFRITRRRKRLTAPIVTRAASSY